MDSFWFLLFADCCQTIAGLIALIAYVPQIVKLRREQSAEDMSLSAWLLWAVSMGLTFFYSLVQFVHTGSGLPLVFSTGVSFAFVALTFFLVVRYHKSEALPLSLTE